MSVSASAYRYRKADPHESMRARELAGLEPDSHYPVVLITGPYISHFFIGVSDKCAGEQVRALNLAYEAGMRVAGKPQTATDKGIPIPGYRDASPYRTRERRASAGLDPDSTSTFVAFTGPYNAHFETVIGGTSYWEIQDSNGRVVCEILPPGNNPLITLPEYMAALFAASLSQGTTTQVGRKLGR